MTHDLVQKAQALAQQRLAAVIGEAVMQGVASEARAAVAEAEVARLSAALAAAQPQTDL